MTSPWTVGDAVKVRDNPTDLPNIRVHAGKVGVIERVGDKLILVRLGPNLAVYFYPRHLRLL